MAYEPRPRTPLEINEQQKRDAERDRMAQRLDAIANSPARPPSPPPAPVQKALAIVPAGGQHLPQLPEAGDNYRQRYLDVVAGGGGIVGRLIKFDKNGKFVTSDDGADVSADREFVVLADETLVGWIKFSEEESVPPDRHMGLLYDSYVMPQRGALGDTDQSQWRLGLSGQPEDPWKHQIALVLQDRET